ncbi:MAG: hypothetical protein GTN80_06805, partial [Nitrososphaeria archaeon]|nr:hypothetical protein [Nitrososphaeria archaeon]
MNDFIGSFKTRDPKKTSIWDQLNRISEFEGYAYLIIVGHYEDSDYMSQRKCSKKEFNGALNSIATRYYGRIQIRQVDYGIQEDEE